MAQTYSPSGVASASGVLKTALFGILASLILPAVYIIVNRLIPNIWFAAISAIMLGIGLGFFIDLGIKIGKIRSIKAAVSIAVFCGLLAFYFQWVLFDELMYSEKGFTFNLSADDLKILAKDVFHLFIHPNILFKEIAGLNEVGTFRIEGSSNLSGLMLWIIWFGEFVIILTSILIAVINGQVAKPFSELNDDWMKLRKPFVIIPYVGNKSEFISELEKRNFDVLKQSPAELDSNSFAEVIISESPGDPLKFVTVLNTSTVKERWGKEKVKKENVVKQFPISDANF
ncbi:hypothetical protein [Pedobacter nototheniae]|uniref:hypothetical protein n=1 Tax=Pedobacter nototheniae TaxID=2488994 RepID=UPI00292F243F|nr:hypothetical protein [Pedobacter nototheniae]